MAYLKTAALITRIREVIEDSRGAMRTVPTGRFSGDMPQGLTEEEQQRRAMVNPRARVEVNDISRQSQSPPINSNLIFYEVGVTVTVSRLFARDQQLNDDTGDVTQAAGAEDVDIIRQALEWPGNLDYTEAGAPTGVISGMLSFVSSSSSMIGQIDQGAQRLETTVSFHLVMVSRPEVYRVKEFTASGTWDVPAGVTLIGISAWAGGGGGGAASTYGGGGGGGGAIEVTAVTVPVTPGETITVTVGAGGAAGAAGGDTVIVGSFGTGTVLGGSAGVDGTVLGQGAGGAGGAATGATYAGGAGGGGGGLVAYGGGGGGGAGTGSAGSAGTATGTGGNGGTMGGAGGTRDGGRGGNGAAGTTASATGGTPGGGGGGASTGAAASAGARGFVQIFY